MQLNALTMQALNLINCDRFKNRKVPTFNLTVYNYDDKAAVDRTLVVISHR